MTEGILHGPYYQWTRKVNGKTVNISLDPESAKTVKEWIQNNRGLCKATSADRENLIGTIAVQNEFEKHLTKTFLK